MRHEFDTTRSFLHPNLLAITLPSMANMYQSLWLAGPHNNSNNGPIPTTSFPSRQRADYEEDIISSMLINSDSQACNESLSVFIKFIIDTIYGDGVSMNEKHQRTYHNISTYALKLLNLNLFVKNYHFCIGKILAFLSTFTALTDSEIQENQNLDPPSVESNKIRYEGECLKEFLCIVLLLLLKIKNCQAPTIVNEQPSEYQEAASLALINTAQLYETLEHFDTVTVLSKFIATHVIATDLKYCSFVLLKFGCDIVFEYLFHKELLSDNEFTSLTTHTQTNLIPTLIKYLLSNENFNNYDIDGDDFEDEDKLIAYEEFKLLLLINEQYLMKSYTCGDVKNKVFDLLMNDDTGPNNSNITGFINLLVYHLNREESHIIKILILKFLYLVFTSSYTTKLVYLNDLKIMVDIFIREINDLDYNADNEHKILMITYLKVLYPLVMFSQLSEVRNGYKKGELVDLLRNLILNSSASRTKDDAERKEHTVSILAGKCMSVPWLKEKDKARPTNSSSSSLTSVTVDSLYEGDLNTSSDSLAASFTRVASVRASSRNDFYKHTTTHNITQNKADKRTSNIFKDNNNNIFLGGLLENLPNDEEDEEKLNILELPSEYLQSKPLPQVPALEKNLDYENESNSSASTNSLSLLVRKALKKKAPPPPPPHHILERSTPNITHTYQSKTPHHSRCYRSTPPPPATIAESKTPTPPPPPPRRRR